MLDLGAGLSIAVSPGVFPNVPACKIGATDGHSSGRGEVYQLQTVFVCCREKAFPTSNGAEEFLPSDLCICVSDDDLNIVSWALSIGFLEELVELFFYVIGFSFVGAYTFIRL